MKAVLAQAERKRAVRRVGRFMLIEELGRGAQATVWRAHDERLDREVALKLLRPDADSVAVSQWLHEARAVSRLAHPNIVPVFEADDSGGHSYLVFELVRGTTLADICSRRGAIAAREAAELMLGVLDALRAAHDQGIVHRDLKPSNVLVDADGRARVMDFGIAARVADDGDGLVVGTPGFMSPEAAQGMAPMPCMDVFSAGMLLAELLAGAPLLRERDTHRALQRVIHEDFALPASVQIDDTLRGIVHRAIARDPALRYDSAAHMREALARWLHPEPTPEAEAAAGEAQDALVFLLRKMRHRSDFPALSDAVARIQRIASSDRESLASLAGEILKDVALTNKLLRVVNSAHYSGRSDGGVSTISRAIALVGFAGIRNLALSLIFVEHMRDKAHAARLKSEFLRSLLAGQVAGELARSPRENEEAFLGAMLHNLGRLLAEYYFPDEAQQVRDRAPDLPGDPDAAAQREQRSAEQVLGIRYDVLGLGVSRHWGLPESLQHCMRSTPGTHAARASGSAQERLRCLARLGNEAAAVLLTDAAPALRQERMRQLVERHGRALGIVAADLEPALARAQARLVQTAPVMGLPLPAALGAAGGDAATVRIEPGQPPATSATLVERPGEPGIAPPDRAADTTARVVMLAAGIQDVTRTIAADRFRLNEVLRMILETMMRALNLKRVLFCLRDAGGEELRGRIGLGDQAMVLAPHFHIPLRPVEGAAPSLFAAVCQKGADTLISDACAPAIAERLPAWFHTHVRAQSFLLLPLTMKGAPLGLIYADVATQGTLALGDQELAMVRTLRDQAVMAFRRA